MNVFKTQQLIPGSIQEAWEFFSSPNNLAVITPDYMNFVITSSLPEKMYPGMFISYKVSPFFGYTMEWVTEITHIEKERFFIDEQRKGPYRIWHHEHHFKELPGGVLLEDKVSFELPLGILGRIFLPFVRSRIDEIFDYRAKKIVEIFGKFNSEPI
ncbi:SRPBCC family protein [Xanthovirga aplysinae]|uniref:SRPBCC family protein n=1 Tax=Xanthovirga aplysinae TaxID=2529853 RepID=UPI0012BC5D48|nr:SRPBCC family protein [Xanthovirga aplysinae]MTI30609.1 hypothetical protein [Xanthovirga aplysinae]